MNRTMKVVMILATLGCRCSLEAAESRIKDESIWRYCTSEDGGVTILGVACDRRGQISIPATLGGRPVRDIAPRAFCKHHGLTAVYIPRGVTDIGYHAFAECRNLTCVTIPDSVRHVGRGAFANCDKALYDTKPIPGVKLVGRWAIGSNGTPSGLLDLSGTYGVAEDAFFGCTKITEVKLSAIATTVGDKAFEGCTGLKRVTIPQSTTFIGRSAFYGCYNLKELSVAKGNPRYIVEDGCLCDLWSKKRCKIGPYLYIPAETKTYSRNMTKRKIKDGVETTLKFIGYVTVAAFCLCAYVLPGCV